MALIIVRMVQTIISVILLLILKRIFIFLIPIWRIFFLKILLILLGFLEKESSDIYKRAGRVLLLKVMELKNKVYGIFNFFFKAIIGGVIGGVILSIFLYLID